MDQATLFEQIMQAIWEEPHDGENFIARAVADRLKGKARFDPSNALAVLKLVWPDADVQLRTRNQDRIDSDDSLLFDVKFADESQVMIVAEKYGNGKGVERAG